MRIAGLFSFLVALTATAVTADKIADVKAVQGSWCRNSTHQLKAGDSVDLTDDVRYCKVGNVVKEDFIQLVFKRTPPYERSYTCSTPGICGPTPQKLWIVGAYLYGQPKRGRGTPLISKPNTSSLIVPDLIIDNETGLPANFKAVLARKKLIVCQINIQYSLAFTEEMKPTDCEKPEQLDTTKSVTQPQLYGIYSPASAYQFSSSGSESNWAPLGLILKVEPNSKSLQEWHAVPTAVLADHSPSSIQERRSYLLDLLEKEQPKQPAPNLSATPTPPK